MLPPLGNHFRVRRTFQGLREGTRLTVHGYQNQRCGRRLVLFATPSGTTATRVGNYYLPIALLPEEVPQLLEAEEVP